MDMRLLPKAKERALQWLNGPYDRETQREIQTLIDRGEKQALIDAFYANISFGTGGMRGVMGVGTSRLNRYTIHNATQGLVNYIHSQKIESPSIFISYDSRKNSRLFAEEAARIVAGNKIKVFLTKKLRPTPFVSFCCRYHRCTAAIMITASHNPPEYNGYKVYWSDGAQVVPPHDRGIIDQVNKIESPDQIRLAHLNSPLIHLVEGEDDAAYYDALLPLQNFPKDNHDLGNNLHVVYSPLHGCGSTTLPEALKRWGFTSLSFVESQMHPDGAFPTVHSPNPEQKEALKLGIEKLQKEKADILFVTDPDADRIALVAMHQNAPIVLSGNQIASICLYYLCTTLSNQRALPKSAACATTVVTTELFCFIASSFNIPCFVLLPGFKYIGELIGKCKQHSILFSAEESLGFLYGTHARDKDGTSAACLLAEIALQQKKAGKTLVDLLDEIYGKFGPFREEQLSIPLDGGPQGKEKINALMENLRKTPPKEICGQRVVIIEDYLNSEKKNLITKIHSKLSLPPSNILVFRLLDNSKFVVRPSGTEPKIKLYGFSRSKEGERLSQCLQKLKNTYLSLA